MNAEIPAPPPTLDTAWLKAMMQRYYAGGYQRGFEAGIAAMQEATQREESRIINPFAEAN